MQAWASIVPCGVEINHLKVYHDGTLSGMLATQGRSIRMLDSYEPLTGLVGTPAPANHSTTQPKTQLAKGRPATKASAATVACDDQTAPDSELELIGALLVSGWHDAVASLQPAFFKHNLLRRAYAAITECKRCGEPPVSVILDNPAFEAAEIQALRELARDTFCASPELIEYFAKRVQRGHLERERQQAAVRQDWAAVNVLTVQIDRLAGRAPNGLTYSPLNTVQAIPIEWLWRPFIAKRAITLIAGDSDVGKSKATAAIVAAITTGTPFPMSAMSAPAGRVVILSAEEDSATMLKPALLAAGADTSKVTVVESALVEYDSKGRMLRRTITLQRDIEELRTLVHTLPDTRVIIIDPVSAYLGDKLDSNSNTAVRAVLADLQRLAEEFNIAIILLSHFGKDTERSAKARVLGSTAFVAGPRQVISIMRDPQDPTKERRYFIPTKVNLSPEAERTGLAFVIRGIDVTDGPVFIPNVGRVEWLPERVTLTADDILSMTRQQERERNSGNSGNSGLSIERQAVIKALRDAGVPLSSRHIAEAVYGEELPDFKDARRGAIRRLLGKMLTDSQIEQLVDRSYTLLPNDGNSGNSSNSGNSGNSGNS